MYTFTIYDLQFTIKIHDTYMHDTYMTHEYIHANMIIPRAWTFDKLYFGQSKTDYETLEHV